MRAQQQQQQQQASQQQQQEEQRRQQQEEQQASSALAVGACIRSFFCSTSAVSDTKTHLEHLLTPLGIPKHPLNRP